MNIKNKKYKYKILNIDPFLSPYESDIELRMNNYFSFKNKLLSKNESLSSFANGHLYFGFHKSAEPNGWYYREWAPNAEEISLVGEFNNWDSNSHKLNKINQAGVWEIFIPGINTLNHGSKIKIRIKAKNKTFDRIPSYCKRVAQNPETYEFYGQIWDCEYKWRVKKFNAKKIKTPIIYESHIGMCGEEEKVAGFKDYIEIVLPRVKNLGYNTVQLMAVMEHPYYGSFGYQVSSFFAVSSRFGTPEELKELIDTAHEMGIAVLLDLVHSHAAPNVAEGLAEFDGTDYQFFHAGEKGSHPAWGTKLFNYGKPEVAHFLLSNLKFWLEEYKFDGFRFDGVTSMLYHDHGLGESFDNYKKYFSPNTDTQSVTYLQLASELCKEVKPDCILIAEDMSGMPGMCLPIKDGGIGFDYRLGMGTPDFWIKNLKTKKDEEWNMGQMFWELTQRRPKEKVIGYCESHDQALVGDKTIMFWLADKEMYWHMNKDSQNLIIDRAIALHKMIRLITCMCAGEGYLNFMGNEFGHPEWIDFPRPENGYSYHHARRLWSLADDENLRYIYLQDFDKAMINLAKKDNLLKYPAKSLYTDEKKKFIAFIKNNYLFLFNFHVSESYDFWEFMKKQPGEYTKILDTAWKQFGGWKNSRDKINKKENQQFLIERRTAAVYLKNEDDESFIINLILMG
ncbi:MAG: alpha-amylase family glycosyl hydrolase [Oscillospiraceae bacterium]|nr:alpha-amylase family glycosyl hydrolase [Oscillospiraceae bacterium]